MEGIMILPNNTSILRNIKDSFYYNGIEISKKNFSIEEFAKVCDKINDFKHQIREEKTLNEIRKNHPVIGRIYLESSDTYLLCKINRQSIYFGLYNENTGKIFQLSKEIFYHIHDEDIFRLSFELNKMAKLISKEIIQTTTIKNATVLYTFENYIETIEKSGNSFQNTYELEFINGYKEYILTDEELKKSIIER